MTSHKGPPRLLMDHVVFMLYGENMSYRKPFIPNTGTDKTVYSGRLWYWEGMEGQEWGRDHREQEEDLGMTNIEAGLHECMYV